MNDAILRKIKRCMDLSESSNENEAAMAIKQMQLLMSKHGISSQHVMAFDVCEHGTRLSVSVRPAKWVLGLHSVIGQAMDCESIISTGGFDMAKLVYLGVGTTAEIAGYAFEVLYRKLKSDRSEFIKTHLFRCKRSNKTKLADAYCDGWVRNVYAKVKNLNPNLEVKEKIAAYKQTGLENYDGGVFESKERYNTDDDRVKAALIHGYNESKDVNLFAATGHSAQKLIGRSHESE